MVDLLQTFAAQSVLAIHNARLFQEIEEKGRELADANKHKSEFLANMSHELRTPLNAILGYTELILDNIYGEVPEKVQEVLERLEKNGRHLLSLINDVLDLSKIEAGRMEWQMVPLRLTDVVKQAVDASFSLVEQKGLELVLTEEAKQFLIKKGSDTEFGARPLRRAIETYIEDLSGYLAAKGVPFHDGRL